MFGIGSGNGSFGFRFFCVLLEQLSSPPPCCQYPAVKPVNEQLFVPVLLWLESAVMKIKIKKVYLGVDSRILTAGGRGGQLFELDAKKTEAEAPVSRSDPEQFILRSESLPASKCSVS